MDFFRILAYNNARTIPETTVSSLINYFLNPYEDHGFRYEFLGLVLEKLGMLPANLSREGFCHMRPHVHVEAESNCDDLETKDRRGNIDSIVTIQLPDGPLVLGIEVKIHAASINNVDSKGRAQLNRYCEFLWREFGEQCLANRAKLVCLTPMHGPVVNYIKSTSAALEESAQRKVRDVLIVLPWTPCTMDNSWIACTSMLDILSELLLNEQSGRISPADPHSVAVIKSMCHAARNNFSFEFASQAGPFPDNAKYRESLQSAGEEEVIDGLLDAISHYSPRLSAKTIHTSIGIPKGPLKDANGQSNRLCRVQTVDRYDVPVTTFNHVVIQLSASQYRQEDVNSVLELYNATEECPIRLEPDFSELYHPDGKRRERVYLIHLHKRADATRASIGAWFSDFFDRLRAMN